MLRGRVLQVLTGEGKTRIIAGFAMFNVLLGLKVDVIMPSPVLAREGAQQCQKVAEMYESTVSVNEDT